MESVLTNTAFYITCCIISFILGVILYWGLKTDYGMKKIDFEANIVVVILIIGFSIFSYVTASVFICGIIMTFLVCLSESDDKHYQDYKERFLKATNINVTKLLKNEAK